MISDSTHPKTRVSNSRKANEAREHYVVQRIHSGEAPKVIAADLRMRDTSVRNLLRKLGYSPMIVSEAERKIIVAARRKSA